MRLPVKSEADAFFLAWGSAALIGVSLAVGALLSPAAGAALFAGAVIGAVGWDLAKDDRAARLRDAASRAPAGDGKRPRILVVANETMGGRELREELLRRGGAQPELRVVAPVLPSRAHYIASDIDRELGEARARLDATLEWAREQGLDASGRVGDDTPLTSIEDELRRFHADELIVSTHPPGRSRWLETGLVERARDELDIPVTHVVVDLENQEVEIRTGAAGS
jgi:hypothetical protein